MASTELDLGQRNPGVASDVIHTLVQRAFTRLAPAKVHTYLPILVVREVQAGLRDRSAAQPFRQERRESRPADGQGSCLSA